MLPMESGPMRAGRDGGRTLCAVWTVKKLPSLKMHSSYYELPYVKYHGTQAIAGTTALQQT